MTQLNPYLSFNGNCREAMTFYTECLGGDLTLQTIAESPIADQIPAESRQQIMHSTLIKDGSVLLMASDMMRSTPVHGNTVTLSLNCSSEAETTQLFTALSAGGTVTDPLEIKFWGGLFGAFTDKYGQNWLVNYQP